MALDICPSCPEPPDADDSPVDEPDATLIELLAVMGEGTRAQAAQHNVKQTRTASNKTSLHAEFTAPHPLLCEPVHLWPSIHDGRQPGILYYHGQTGEVRPTDSPRVILSATERNPHMPKIVITDLDFEEQNIEKLMAKEAGMEIFDTREDGQICVTTDGRGEYSVHTFY